MFAWDRWSPDGYRALTTIDVHAAGEPLRIITGGIPEIPGATMLERRRWLREQLDDVRQLLMWEPRGHENMYGCVVTPPVRQESDLGVLFLHNEGYSTMCGHGVIGLVTALVETGAIPRAGLETPVNLDTPAGLVRARAICDERGRVERVAFVNVPSFVLAHDLRVELEGGETVTTDVIFGGAFYALAPAASFGLRVSPEQTEALVAAADRLSAAVRSTLPIEHPDHPDLGFLYGSILTGPPEDPTHHSCNVCVFARSEVDRSPTGTGVSGRVALLAARGEIQDGEPVAIESILGRESVFQGRVVDRTTVGPYPAVVPEVSGSAYITGRHQFLLDPADRLGRGFLLR